uniref:Uncharacterized protein n=1 Tax=Timema cristinae TaxID=61476 RepID=A0A7R9CCQ1_TIMCR|nr:unnamed protein product [Timema cristinae]
MGGENQELSFKIWMCGEILDVVLFFRVGNIFRGRRPYRFGKDVLKENFQRLVEVWLDEYAQYYYEFTGHKTVAYGDVSSCKDLRRKLECDSFEWFMENIIPEMFVPKDTMATGELRNIWSEKCLDRFGQNVGPLKEYPCRR